MDQVKSYDYTVYTASDVRAALNHETCSVRVLSFCFLRRQSRFSRGNGSESPHGNRTAFRKHSVSFYASVYCKTDCENYCVYCGFNCYNHISRMKLSMEQIEKEMKIIADSGMEEILNLQEKAAVRVT